MAELPENLNRSRSAKGLLLGFFNPELFGAWVLTAVLSLLVGSAYYFGYGCVLRMGGVLVLFLLPTAAVAVLLVAAGGWLQAWLWRGPLKQAQPGPPRLDFVELLSRTFILVGVGLLASAFVGSQLRAAQARKTCADAAPLLANIERERSQHGTYPTNIRAFVKSNAPLRRKYLFYYGDSNTNGVEWQPHHVANADISLFVSTNQFQCVVPIERMSPINFSSFRVFLYSSDHPAWRSTLLHWSLLGAYMDEPEK